MLALLAEDSRGLNDSPTAIAETCEEILLSCGMADEAYRRYAIEANRRTTYLATFRAPAAKYPHKAAADLLRDLVAASPGEEGKWFAAAKSAGLYREAIELATSSPAIRTHSVGGAGFGCDGAPFRRRGGTRGAAVACRGLWLRDHQSGFSHHILAQRVLAFIFHLVHKAVGSTDHLVDGGR